MPVSGILASHVCLAHSFTSFRSLLECLLLSLIKISSLPLSGSSPYHGLLFNIALVATGLLTGIKALQGRDFVSFTVYYPYLTYGRHSVNVCAY